jgi:hypothetical protein
VLAWIIFKDLNLEILLFIIQLYTKKRHVDAFDMQTDPHSDAWGRMIDVGMTTIVSMRLIISLLFQSF